MTIHELSRLLANLIREATVKAYNADGTVIVESGGLVSQPLRFFQPSAGKINTHRLIILDGIVEVTKAVNAGGVINANPGFLIVPIGLPYPAGYCLVVITHII